MNTQPDYIALGILIAFLPVVVVMLIRKWCANRAAAF